MSVAEIALTQLDPPCLSNLSATIVIVSYNSRHYLETCLGAVLETAGQAEILVVDNASSDGSPELVAEKYPQIKLVRNTENTGFAAANNQAAKLAHGQFLVGLNPDTKVAAGWLEALLAPFDQNQVGKAKTKIGITTPRILMLAEPDKINTCGNNMHYTGLTICRGLNLGADTASMLEQCEVPAISGACFAIRRELWEKLGGFDETFFTYLEDTDLSLRAKLAGYSCVYVPQSVVYHDYSSRFSSRKLYFLERNRWLMLLKSFQVRTLAILLPALLLTELISGAYACKSGLAAIRAKLATYKWLWQNWAEIKTKRQATQKLRQISDIELLAALIWQLDTRQLAGEKLGKVSGAIINPLFRLNYLLGQFLSK